MEALAVGAGGPQAPRITPKYIYTIPTVQNPTGTIMPEGAPARLLKLAEQYAVAGVRG